MTLATVLLPTGALRFAGTISTAKKIRVSCAIEKIDMAKYMWLDETHRKTLTEARALLVTLIEPPMGIHPALLPVQSMTEEHEILQSIVADIEELLGY